MGEATDERLCQSLRDAAQVSVGILELQILLLDAAERIEALAAELAVALAWDESIVTILERCAVRDEMMMHP